jgi:hypothetical protein
VPSELSPQVPLGCEITFAQVLSRHGARDPTAGKSVLYNATIRRLQASATDYGKGYEFLRDYVYSLGADQLTPFGERQMLDSGSAFYHRYAGLARKSRPFIRASGQNRVVVSALNWTQGFHGAQLADGGGGGGGGGEHYSGSIVVIPEKMGLNNSLNHGLCTAFEEGPYSGLGDEAQREWLVFAKPITERLNSQLPGTNISALETIFLMDMCPFTTVAADPDAKAKISPFCELFTFDEWLSYDYYWSLGKYYTFGPGNGLGPTQGVGFVNELIARLTRRPVVDSTTTNTTLDGAPATFPLDRVVYADFTHDNDMTTVYGALGLYDAVKPLAKDRREGPREAGGYSASWTVPFAARMYVEKMRCGGAGGPVGKGVEEGEELVRILINDRVVPLQGCGADSLGRCTLDAFVESLAFARSGGRWKECFA